MAPPPPPPSSGTARRPGSGGGVLTQYFFFILLGFGVLTLYMNSRHSLHDSTRHFQNQHFSVASLKEEKIDLVQKEEDLAHHPEPVEEEDEPHEQQRIAEQEKEAAEHDEKEKENETKQEAIKQEEAAPEEKKQEVEEQEPPKNEKEDTTKDTAKKEESKKQEEPAQAEEKKQGEPAQAEEKKQEEPQEAKKQEAAKQDDAAQEKKDNSHELAGLDCSKYGGPSNDVAAEMVYWSDIPSDNLHVSPFYSPEKFLTFEPDQGGWNNIRMSMESVLAMAVAMGRTLVLPPEQGMYLLDKHKNEKKEAQRKHFSFNNFFHMESIANEHPGLNIITMDEFLEKEAMTGKLRDGDGNIKFPPGNRTDWNGSERKGLKALDHYLRSVSHWPTWDPEDCLVAFPASKDPADLQVVEDRKKQIDSKEGPKDFMTANNYMKYIGKPSDVDAPAEVRMKENWAQRKTLCIYDDDMQGAPLVHFGYDYGGKGARLLVHFYAFLFFEDWRQDLWMKRFVRDHVRYVDEIQCAAARVVNAVRERARERTGSGEFDAFHIRRGDFQYTVTRFDADKILRISQDMLTPNATVYIGTDERDRNFFKPLADVYDVVFLEDFKHLLTGVNSNYFGMLDQLITSRSRVFFGCWFSTFTGYINRMRGYHADKEKAKGHEQGIVRSYYYALEDRKMHMQEFYPVKKSFYAREFPTSWRGIDKGIGELKTTKQA